MKDRFGDIDFLAQSNVGKPKEKTEKSNDDWANFDFGEPPKGEKPKGSDNLIDFD